MIRTFRAFTLVELLVVVSVIAILIAMMAPALDKAVYQAELAVCGAQMKGICYGITVYTSDYRRQYPNNPGVEAQAAWQNNKFFAPGQATDANGQDLRVITRQ